MAAFHALLLRRAFRSNAKPAARWPMRRAVATAAATGPSTTRTFLGTTAGTALFVFSGSLLVWPAADLVLGPKLVLWGMRADPTQTGDLLDSEVATRVSRDTTSARESSITVVSGVPGAGKQLEHIAAHSERPVVYIAMREATSPHDLYFAVLAGIYSANRLGFLGVLAHSMGVWWIVLFDIIVGHEPEKTRAFNFSVILQHLRRALRAAHVEQPLDVPRPLVILDHLEEPFHCKDCPTMRSMLTHLQAWCAATCYDDGLADIVICDAPAQSSWRRSGNVEHLHSSHTFQDCLRKRY